MKTCQRTVVLEPGKRKWKQAEQVSRITCI